MSIARVHAVDHSMKEYTCDKCGVVIPKRSAYRHYKVGFRSRHKYVRCMKSECTPRPSELESSLASGAYAAVEGAEDSLSGAACAQDITDALEEAASGIREVADQYRESAEAMGGAGSDMEERADTLESAADELESHQVEYEDPEDGATEDCGECGGTGEVEIDCPTCHGSGKAHDVPRPADCPNCEGSGNTKDACNACEGTGQVDAEPDPEAPTLEDAVAEALEVLGGVEL